MFPWFSKPKPIDVVSVDIANARALLQKLRLQLDQAGTRTSLSYRQGVVEVSNGLAHALDLSVSDVLGGRVRADQAAAVCRDIDAAQAQCQEYLSSSNKEARALAGTLLFGCTVFSHLYRMRLHQFTAHGEQRAEAGALASSYANLAQALFQMAGPAK
jgi:hypothetical protein